MIVWTIFGSKLRSSFSISAIFSFLKYLRHRQGRRQDVAAGGGKNHKRGHIFKYNVECMQQPPWKKSLAICKLYSRLTRPRKLYRYERRTGWAPSFDVLQLGQGKRQELAYFANRWNDTELRNACWAGGNTIVISTGEKQERHG